MHLPTQRSDIAHECALIVEGPVTFELMGLLPAYLVGGGDGWILVWAGFWAGGEVVMYAVQLLHGR
jgi:hypothetical protein